MTQRLSLYKQIALFLVSAALLAFQIARAVGMRVEELFELAEQGRFQAGLLRQLELEHLLDNFDDPVLNGEPNGALSGDKSRPQLASQIGIHQQNGLAVFPRECGSQVDGRYGLALTGGYAGDHDGVPGLFHQRVQTHP